MSNNFRALTDVDRVIHEPARTMIIAILYNLESADFSLPAARSRADERESLRALDQTRGGRIHPNRENLSRQNPADVVLADRKRQESLRKLPTETQTIHR